MRKVILLSLGLGAVVMLAPTEVQSQYGPGAMHPGGTPSSSYSRDPIEAFDRLSHGKGYLTAEDVSGLETLRADFNTYMRATGSSSNQMTRSQYQDLLDWRKQQQAARGAGGGGGAGGFPGSTQGFGNDPFHSGGGPGGSLLPYQGGPDDQSRMHDWNQQQLEQQQWMQQHLLAQQRRQHDPDAQLEIAFKQHPLTPDGMYMTKQGASPQLQAQWDIWDFDHNGLIDVEEYKAYKKAEMAGWNPQKGGPNPFRPSWAYEPPTPVYRQGKLPKGLPAWFAELANNDEAQIFLYDWRAAGKKDEEFFAMDRNGDGILTVEEVLYYVKAQMSSAAAWKGIKPVPDPGNLMAYQGQTGIKLAFTVTGSTVNGGAWGANPYTLDSALSITAVHAGVLKAGETGVVLLELIASPESFPGTTQNGVTTGGFGVFQPGAYHYVVPDKSSKPGKDRRPKP